jgi:hypothetical protein
VTAGRRKGYRNKFVGSTRSTERSKCSAAASVTYVASLAFSNRFICLPCGRECGRRSETTSLDHFQGLIKSRWQFWCTSNRSKVFMQFCCSNLRISTRVISNKLDTRLTDRSLQDLDKNMPFYGGGGARPTKRDNTRIRILPSG